MSGWRVLLILEAVIAAGLLLSLWWRRRRRLHNQAVKGLLESLHRVDDETTRLIIACSSLADAVLDEGASVACPVCARLKAQRDEWQYQADLHTRSIRASDRLLTPPQPEDRPGVSPSRSP